ncbi:MAG: hypothetical protein AAGA80_22290, partial [Cyanobacteria bacterium P01_F01_bin.143]
MATKNSRGLSAGKFTVEVKIRENEQAAAAAGKNIEAFRLQAFVIGAALMGLGGALLA